MFRKPLIVLMLLIVAGVGVYAIRQNGASVYYRIIDEPADALDTSRIEWITQKNAQKGVHLYSVKTSTPYELLFYDNTRYGEQQDRYRTSTLHAKLYGQTLRIDIDEQYAMDESFINDRILAHFIIKDEPAIIEVYRNGVKEQYDIESGTEKISQ